MSITRYDPNKIHLGGMKVDVNDLAASESITPGHLIDRFNAAGVIRFRKHNTASVATAPIFAEGHFMANKGVDDPYVLGDLVEAFVGQSGTTVWAYIASGQTVVAGNKLESAGDGTLKVGTTAPIASALENKTATALTRLRVEVL
jgi:hypothetical protein